LGGTWGIGLRSFRSVLLRLGSAAPETARKVVPVPPGCDPGEWLLARPEARRLPQKFPLGEVTALALELARADGRWLVETGDLVVAIVHVAGMPLQEPFAERAAAAAVALAGRRGGEGDEDGTPSGRGSSGGAPVRGRGDGGGDEGEEEETPVLASFATDLTRAAREGRLPPVVGRSREIDTVIEVLCRLTKRNPLLVGPPGCGKTAVVAGLAQRIVAGTVPEPLAGARVMAMSAGDLVAGTKYVGTLEERLVSLIEEASRLGILLFLDEIHLAVGAGATSKSDSDVANLLKPALADGRIACIGATTDLEVERLLLDPAFERRFQRVEVEELPPDAAVEALRARAAYLAGRTAIAIGDRAVELAASLADRLIRHRTRPDKGIDVLERAVARARVRGAAEVTPALVREVVHEMVGMPFEPQDLERRLRLMGGVLRGLGLLGEAAVRALVGRLLATMPGLDVHPQRPNAVLLAVGPRRGAEELARVISEVLFGNEEIVELRLGPGGEDLTGSWDGGWKMPPPAWQRGLIHRPWSVVLVTGLEHEEPASLDRLADAMERGFLAGTRGRRVPLADAIFVLVVEGRGTARVGFGAGGGGEVHVEDVLGRRLAAQVDIVCPLEEGAALPQERWIRSRLLVPVAERWERELGVRVHFDGAVARALAAAAGRERLGRERLERLFEERVVAPLARVIARAAEGSAVRVALRSERPLAVRCLVRRPEGAAARGGGGPAEGDGRA